MENEKFNELLLIVKYLQKNKIDFPDYGTQNIHTIIAENEFNNKFQLVINRKGHLRRDNLTYQMMSKRFGILVRLDMSGSPHDDRFGNSVDTPHVHIFDEEHNNGRWAIPLSDLSDSEIIFELYDSLVLFLKYNNVKIDNVKIPMI